MRRHIQMISKMYGHIQRVRSYYKVKTVPSACAIEAPADNYPNQEHPQDCSAQCFDSDDDVIVETPVHNSEYYVLARERDNCTLWIKQPVDWTRFLTDTSYNNNNEDLKKSFQNIHGIFLHVDPRK